MIESDHRSICIIGVDGAGKTTVGEAIADETTYSGQQYQYWWCGWREFRSLPFRGLRTLIQLLLSNSASESTTETNSSLKDPGTIQKCIGLLYFPFVFVDHFLTTAPKALLRSLQNRPVVYDRYYYGMVIGFCAYYAYPEWLVRLLMRLSVLYPSPDIVLYLDVEPETAFERKDDVPSPDYIQKRRDQYVFVTERTAAVTVDAEQSPEQVKQDALLVVRRGH